MLFIGGVFFVLSSLHFGYLWIIYHIRIFSLLSLGCSFIVSSWGILVLKMYFLNMNSLFLIFHYFSLMASFFLLFVNVNSLSLCT